MKQEPERGAATAWSSARRQVMRMSNQAGLEILLSVLCGVVVVPTVLATLEL